MTDSSTQQQELNPLNVDVAIVGAGLVGLPVALALSAKGWSVALVDASEPPHTIHADVTGKDSRVPALGNDALAQRCTAINLGTQQWLSSQGLWSNIEPDACAISRVNVSHKGYFGATRLSAQEMDLAALGYVVNNRSFVHTLTQLCGDAPIQRLYNARVSSVDSCNDNLITLKIDGHTDLNTRLLVAADGINSVVRESTGLATTQVDYDQAAVLGMVKLNTAHDGRAFERFTASGPLALLPRPGPYMNFVDCLEPSEQADIEAMSDQQYLDRLQNRFGYRMGRFQDVGPRFVLPLLRIESESQIAHRTVLMGNAVRLLHPVGGQGFNLAIRDVEALVTLLDKKLVDDPGSDELLSQFSTSRESDQQSIVRLTDALARGFRGTASIPSHLRSGLLLGLDTLSPLRKQFAQKTMGVTGL